MWFWRKIPRLVSIMIKPPYPGDHITIRSILGEEVVVTAFAYLPSQFDTRLSYLAIQIRRGGKLQWFTTQSSYIIDHFERVAQEQLPCRACFNLVKDEKGKRTYTVS